MPIFEVEISSPNGQLRTVRINCSSPAEAWQSIRLNDGEQATLREIVDASGPNTTTSSLQSKPVAKLASGKSPNRLARTTPASASVFIEKLSAFDLIAELLFGCWVSAFPEKYLDGSKFRPSVLVPASVVARRGLSLLYWLVIAFGILRAAQESGYGSDGDPVVLVIIYISSGIFSWMIIIGLIRYVFFVYPWEKRRSSSDDR